MASVVMKPNSGEHCNILGAGSSDLSALQSTKAPSATAILVGRFGVLQWLKDGYQIIRFGRYNETLAGHETRMREGIIEAAYLLDESQGSDRRTIERGGWYRRVTDGLSNGPCEEFSLNVWINSGLVLELEKIIGAEGTAGEYKFPHPAVPSDRLNRHDIVTLYLQKPIRPELLEALTAIAQKFCRVGKGESDALTGESIVSGLARRSFADLRSEPIRGLVFAVSEFDRAAAAGMHEYLYRSDRRCYAGSSGNIESVKKLLERLGYSIDYDPVQEHFTLAPLHGGVERKPCVRSRTGDFSQISRHFKDGTTEDVVLRACAGGLPFSGGRDLGLMLELRELLLAGFKPDMSALLASTLWGSYCNKENGELTPIERTILDCIHQNPLSSIMVEIGALRSSVDDSGTICIPAEKERPSAWNALMAGLAEKYGLTELWKLRK